MNTIRFKKGKFNPKGEDLFKGKMTQEAGYKAKQTFLTEDGNKNISEIILKGGISELQKRGSLNNGAEYIVLKIYFVNDEK